MDDQHGLVGKALTQQNIDRWLEYSQEQVALALTRQQELRSQLFEFEVVHQELVWRRDHPRKDQLRQES